MESRRLEFSFRAARISRRRHSTALERVVWVVGAEALVLGVRALEGLVGGFGVEVWELLEIWEADIGGRGVFGGRRVVVRENVRVVAGALRACAEEVARARPLPGAGG